MSLHKLGPDMVASTSTLAKGPGDFELAARREHVRGSPSALRRAASRRPALYLALFGPDATQPPEAQWEKIA